MHEVLTPNDTMTMKTRSEAASTPTSGITRRSWTSGTSASCPNRVALSSTPIGSCGRRMARCDVHELEVGR